jgi:hypothetical protein
MEPVQWDRDPERAAAADFAIRERAQHPTAPIPHTGEVRTGDFRMQGILMEELSTGVIPMVRASEQAVGDFHVEGEEGGLLVEAEAGGAGKICAFSRNLPPPQTRIKSAGGKVRRQVAGWPRCYPATSTADRGKSRTQSMAQSYQGFFKVIQWERPVYGLLIPHLRFP